MLFRSGLGLPAQFHFARLWPWPVAGEPPGLLAGGRLPGGAELVLSWNWMPGYPAYSEELAVFARDGAVKMWVAPPYLLDAHSELVIETGEGDLRERRQLNHGADAGFLAQLEAFLGSVQRGAPVLSDGVGAAADTHCLQRLVMAAAAAHGEPRIGGEAAEGSRS